MHKHHSTFSRKNALEHVDRIYAKVFFIVSKIFVDTIALYDSKPSQLLILKD